MHDEVASIGPRQIGNVIQDQEILSVALFRCFGEIERARNERRVINHHHFVMCDRMLIVDQRFDSRVGQERRRCVLIGLVGLVQHSQHFDSTFMRTDQRFGNRSGSEPVGLYPNAMLRSVNFSDDCFGPTAVRPLLSDADMAKMLSPTYNPKVPGLLNSHTRHRGRAVDCCRRA